MPRLRVVKKPEDSKDIPETEAVQVEITPDEPIVIEGAEPVTETKKLEKKVVVEPEEDKDEAISALQKQLEEMKKAHDLQKSQAEEYDRQRQTAFQQAREREEQYRKTVTRADSAEYDAILNGIGAAQAEIDSAKQALKGALEASDFSALADANERQSRATARLVQLEDGKAALEERRETEKANPKREAPIGDPVEAYIDRMPNLLASQRTWLKSHRELMTDPAKNAYLQAAHFEAVDKKYSVGSDDYYKHVEEKLGYRQVAQPELEDEQEEVIETRQRRPMVAAPVTRDPPSAGTGRPVNSNRITLTPEQRAAARDASVDEVTYAKNLMKLQAMKKEGHYV